MQLAMAVERHRSQIEQKERIADEIWYARSPARPHAHKKPQDEFVAPDAPLKVIMRPAMAFLQRISRHAVLSMPLSSITQ